MIYVSISFQYSLLYTPHLLPFAIQLLPTHWHSQHALAAHCSSIKSQLAKGKRQKESQASLKSPAAAHRQQQQQQRRRRRRRQATMAIELLQPAQKQRPNNKEGKRSGRKRWRVRGGGRGSRNMYIRFKINVTARLIMLRLHTARPDQAKARRGQARQQPAPALWPPRPQSALHISDLLQMGHAATATATAHAQQLLHLMAWAISDCPAVLSPPLSRSPCCSCSANMPAS